MFFVFQEIYVKISTECAQQLTEIIRPTLNPLHKNIAATTHRDCIGNQTPNLDMKSDNMSW